LQRRCMLQVRRIIDKTAEMHNMPRGEMRQNRMRANLLALVRRKRDAMTQKQDLQRARHYWVTPAIG